MNQPLTVAPDKIGKIVVVDGTRHILPPHTNPALLNDNRAICRAISHAMQMPALAEAEVDISSDTINGVEVPMITLRTQPPTKGQANTSVEHLRGIPPARLVDCAVVRAVESQPITIAQGLDLDLAATIDRILQPQERRHTLWLGINKLSSVAADLDGGIGF